MAGSMTHQVVTATSSNPSITKPGQKLRWLVILEEEALSASAAYPRCLTLMVSGTLTDLTLVTLASWAIPQLNYRKKVEKASPKEVMQCQNACSCIREEMFVVAELFQLDT